MTKKKYQIFPGTFIEIGEDTKQPVPPQLPPEEYEVKSVQPLLHKGHLEDLGVSPSISLQWAELLNKTLPEWQINTPLRIAMFLAQVLHESGKFRYLKEIWGPTMQQAKYERDFSKPWPGERGSRNWLPYNLGNSQKGDGKKFMGRGPIQITGRSNYTKASMKIYGDDRAVKDPKIFEQPEEGLKASLWFWDVNKLNELADNRDIVKASQKINGGNNGLGDRQKLYQKALQILNIV